MDNSTIAKNNSAGSGGGIQLRDPASYNIRSSIIADNTGSADISNLFGSTFTANNCLIENGVSPASGANNLTGVDPNLAALADNRGPTETHALNAGSPAIDSGSNPLNLAADQRGFVTREVNGQADMGAFEKGSFNPLAPGNIVPVLSEWGIIALVLGLAGFAFAKIRRMNLTNSA